MSKNKNTKFDDPVTKEVIKKYGHVVRAGIDVFEESSNLKVISVSPALDVALGGGIREGSWVIFTGEPKTGKTTTALHFAANCQKEENGSRPVIFINAEGRLKSMNLGGVKGLDIDNRLSLRPYTRERTNRGCERAVQSGAAENISSFHKKALKCSYKAEGNNNSHHPFYSQHQRDG